MGSGARRAIGVVRVSQVSGRSGESFASPGEQADRIRAACERDGLELLEIVEELDVSGGRELDDRPGLGPAVRAIEEGLADVIVGAYFDRLFRSLRAQGEAVERVERAGGQVLAVDVGRVTGKSAGQWLSSTMLGAVSEYHRRTTAERTREALQRAINRGAAPWPRVTTGYFRGEDGRLMPDPVTAPHVAEAFRLRADGVTVREVREHLALNGITLSMAGVHKLLASRAVLGEVHFGEFEPNLAAHEPIIDRVTWQAAQRTRVRSGRRSRSDRLLARLGVLVCATCGGRMVASTARGARSSGGGGGKLYPIYQCQNADCPRRPSIMAHAAEDVIVALMQEVIGSDGESAQRGEEARRAGVALEHAQGELDAAIRAFSVVGDESAAVERLAELRGARDAARAEVDRLGGLGGLDRARRFGWDALSRDAQRALIRAVVRVAEVRPGRGDDRVNIVVFAE